MAEIDTLQVKITANAKAATASLDSLVRALRRVRSELTGMKDGVSVSDHIAKSLNQMNGALNTITTSGIKRLQKLANALDGYAEAVKKVKNAGNVAASINAAEKAINSPKTSKPKWKSSVVESEYTEEDFKILEDLAPLPDDSAKIKERMSLFKGLTDWAKKAKEQFGALFQHFKLGNSVIGKFFKSVGRIALYRAIRSAIKAIGEAFSEGLKNAYGYSKQSETFQRLADTLDHLKSVTSQMVNQLGAFWGEFKQLIQPAITWLIEKVRGISERLTELFAALNGEKTYLQAQYVAQSWGDATDNVKKYKQQLLGLDELNNLTSQQSGKKDQTDYSKLYKEVAVNKDLLRASEQWSSLKEKITGALTEIELALGGFMVGVGAALLFSGANIPLGLGLMVAGGFMAGKAIKEKWNELNGDISGAIGAIELMLGGFALGIGAALAFSGANIPLGIGLMATGAMSMLKGAKDLKWNQLNKDVKKKVTRLSAIIGGASLALGAVLAFSGINIPLGIALMGTGALGLGIATSDLNWQGLGNTIREKLVSFFGAGGLIGFGAGMLAIGALLAFSGINIPLGIAMMATGAGGLGLGLAQLDWDGILQNLKTAWNNIKVWWNNTVVNAVKKAVGWVEDQLHFDLNKDGTIGSGNISTIETSSSGKVHGGSSFKFGEGSDSGTSSGSSSSGNVVYDAGYSLGQKVRDTLSKTWKGITDLFSWDAVGAIEKPGSLFFAGESGPEFVGSMGSSSAVANTQQMTDAIYKAAYMGMSRALQENGGGMSGFVPATTDDLFIAMRKKASNYNKMTGNSAFA